jgi:diguanylate cyclase (GGDEF)-like protein/PAS domain S-box-containing protein
LAALHALAILDTPPEPAFDDLTRLAATVCGTPIAAISLVDARRLWLKSCVGATPGEAPRAGTICSHTVYGDGLFVVPDAAADERFRDSPFVTGEPHVRFYAGMPLVTPDGHNVGTLCVIDRVPRALAAEQADALRVLARQVVAQMLLRRRVERLEGQARDHETFRVLFERSSDAHLIFDERDGIIDCNHAAVAMLRCRDKGEVLALHPAVLSPEYQPDGRRSLEKCVEMDAAARRNGFHRFDWTHRRADGEEFPCEVTLTPVDLHGRSVLLVVWHDLTERKRAEDALRASKARFRLVWEQSAEGMRLTDAGGTVVMANPAYCRMVGRPAEEVVGRSLAEAFASDARAAILEKHSQRFAAREVRHQAEAEVEMWDGGRRWFEVGDAFLDLPGEPTLLLTVFRDATARKEAEERLRASEERFRTFMDNSPAVAFMKDEAGRFVYLNEPFVRRWIAPGESWLGKDDFEVWPEAAARAFREHDRAVLAGGVPVRLTEDTPEADGSVSSWAVHKFPLTDAAGNRFVAGLAVDVTDEKRAEAALRESEERFRNAFEDAAIGMALVAPDGRWLRVNRSVCEMLGYAPDELLATDFQTITHPDDLGSDLEMARRVLAGDLAAYQMEKRYFRKDGRTVHALLSVSLVRSATGDPLYFVSQIQDVSARKGAEDALRASEAKFRGTLDRLAEGVFLIDPVTERFVDGNAALLAMLGYTAAEFVALDPAAVVAGLTPKEYARHVRDVRAEIARTGRCDLGRMRYRRKDGGEIAVDVRVSLVPNGESVLHAVVVRDVTAELEAEERLLAYQAELEEANARLQALAVTDGLTGVRNRAALDERLADEFARSVRHGRPLSLVLLDVDHFKAFNDAYGHPAGDDVLRRVAGVLGRTVRCTDLVARYGGEEFAVLLPDTELAGAMVLAERCRRAVAAEPWERRLVTVSIGVATVTGDTPTADDLVRRADEALYRSKQAGRNRVYHGGSGTIGVAAVTRS